MKSKSEKKREHHEIQMLGEKLVSISDEKLKEFFLSNELIEAITLARKLKKHGALRRQKQLIGKLTRFENIEYIQNILNKQNKRDRLEKKIFKHTEEWRKRILEEGNSSLDEYNIFIGWKNKDIKLLLKTIKLNPKDLKRIKVKRELFKLIHKDLSALYK